MNFNSKRYSYFRARTVKLATAKGMPQLYEDSVLYQEANRPQLERETVNLYLRPRTRTYDAERERSTRLADAEGNGDRHHHGHRFTVGAARGPEAPLPRGTYCRLIEAERGSRDLTTRVSEQVPLTVTVHSTQTSPSM